MMKEIVKEIETETEIQIRKEIDTEIEIKKR